ALLVLRPRRSSPCWFPPPWWGRVRVGGQPAGHLTPTLPHRGGGRKTGAAGFPSPLAPSPSVRPLAPSPLVGDGWGGGSASGRRVSPPPHPSPIQGEGERLCPPRASPSPSGTDAQANSSCTGLAPLSTMRWGRPLLAKSCWVKSMPSAWQTVAMKSLTLIG